MGFTLDTKDLVSRQIRERIAPEGREISGLLDVFDTGEEVGVFGRLVRIGANFLGFVFANLPKLVLSFAGVVGWMFAKTSQIAQFNWQASDNELRAGLKSRNLAIADAWGNFTGVLAGTIAVGVIGAGIAYYLPVIGGKALALSTITELIQQRGDEVWDELKDALRITFDSAIQNLSVNTFIAVRRYIRNNNPSLKNWGVEDGQRWTIAEEIEERIESIPNEWVRTFTESALEEGWESFIEGGYVIARHWDEQMQQAQANRLEILGEDRAITVELDRENDGEKVRFTKIPSNLAIATAQNTINQYRLLRNRDVGLFEDPDEGVKVLQPYLRTAKIFLRGDKEQPPFITETGDPCSRVQVTLKGLKPNLKWIDFKRVFRYHKWGSFKIEATLKSRVVITIYAEDAVSGKSKMAEILDELIEEEAIRILVIEEEISSRITKQAKAVYPQKAVVTLKRENINGKIKDLAGTRFEQERIEFSLWQDSEPVGTPEYVTNFPTT